MSRPRIDRRAFMAALASAGALAACHGGVPLVPAGEEVQGDERQPHAAGLSTTFDNASGYANSKIVYYVVGQNPAANNAWYCLNANGKLVKLPTGGAPALKLASSGKTTTLRLPPLISGRVYFAIDGKLKIPLDGGGPAWPAGWNPSDPSYTVLHDWFEYTWKGPGNTFTCNTTQVDMFGIPMLLKTNPQNMNSPAVAYVGVSNGGRDKIIDAIKGTKGYSKLVIGTGATPLRVIAPGHGIENGTFSSSYLSDYVSSVWSYYETHTMTLNTDAYGTYKGTASGKNLTFKQSGSPNVVIAKPTTLQAFECDGPLSSADAVTARIGALLAAGINRGTLLLQPGKQPDFTKSNFYKASPTNLYSMIMHQNNKESYAYGFADDDQGSWSSTLSNSKISSFKVTLSSF